jgi:FHA domain
LTTELLLLILRIVSAILLLLLFSAFFWVVWRDYRLLSDSSGNRRSYGRLTRLQSLAGSYVVMPENFPLLPLNSFGRSPTNNVHIDDTFASGDHAIVALRNGRWWLEDRQSTNGTLLNGVPIDQPVIITDGDIISIGQTHYRLDLES